MAQVAKTGAHWCGALSRTLGSQQLPQADTCIPQPGDGDIHVIEGRDIYTKAGRWRDTYYSWG